MNNTGPKQGDADDSLLNWQPTPLQCLSSDEPITKFTVDSLKAVSQCVFKQATSLSQHFKWACIYGSVSKGTQRPDSNVNFLVCYDSGKPKEDVFLTPWIEDQLKVILGREVDVIEYVQGDESMGFQQMEALLTGVLAFGGSGWAKPSIALAEEKLKEGYAPIKEAFRLAAGVHDRLPASSWDFTDYMSPRNQRPRESILVDCEKIRTTVILPNNPFYLELHRTFREFLSYEELIRNAAAKIQAEDASTEDGIFPGRYFNSYELDKLWQLLSDRFSFVWQLQRLVKRADEIAARAGIILNP